MGVLWGEYPNTLTRASGTSCPLGEPLKKKNSTSRMLKGVLLSSCEVFNLGDIMSNVSKSGPIKG
jgi:hypothetical protein